jgi:predicted Ser/Thr protein kinase
MDIEYLNKCMEKISVFNKPNEDVDVINDSPLIMMGKGRQGAVFRFTDEICVKVFGNTDDCDREHYALSLGQSTNLFPKIYAKGPLYIAMEVVKGVDLREYLQSQPLTEELSMKLIDMLITFKNIGYERIDHHKRQVYLQPDGQLKVIDVARTVWRDRVYPYPRKLINSLGTDNKDIFLSHVQALSPELYNEWTYYIEMEKLSSQLCQLLLTEPIDKKKLKKNSDLLLTPNIEQKEYQQIENLVYKVFKNEWVKVMLAKGADLETVKAKIDEYWEKASGGKLNSDDDFYVMDDEEDYYPSYIGFNKDKRKERKSYNSDNYQGYSKNRNNDNSKSSQGDSTGYMDNSYMKRKKRRL